MAMDSGQNGQAESGLRGSDLVRIGLGVKLLVFG